MLVSDSENARFNLEITECGYHCSTVVSRFRPDFAVVDCFLGPERSSEISKHLSEDPRIPFIRLILAGSEQDYPFDCEKEVFARLKRPFGVKDINQCIDGLSWAELETSG